MAAVLVARQGRELQRYSQRTGGRIVVGCIPYRVRCDGELEVLVITSQKGHGMMFPKGGWEEDESMDEAARREALEEAGVLELSQPTLSEGETLADIRADRTAFEDYDADAAGARHGGQVLLDQLVVEHVLGAAG